VIDFADVGEEHCGQIVVVLHCDVQAVDQFGVVELVEDVLRLHGALIAWAGFGAVFRAVGRARAIRMSVSVTRSDRRSWSGCRLRSFFGFGCIACERRGSLFCQALRL
jgi:hypothetical protein